MEMYSTLMWLSEQGERDGRARGLREGECRQLRKLLLRHGKRKLGEPAPEPLALLDALAQRWGLDQLEQARDRFCGAASWATLLEGLRPPDTRPAEPAVIGLSRGVYRSAARRRPAGEPALGPRRGSRTPWRAARRTAGGARNHHQPGPAGAAGGPGAKGAGVARGAGAELKGDNPTVTGTRMSGELGGFNPAGINPAARRAASLTPHPALRALLGRLPHVLCPAPP